jgi:3-methyladenine DNA glycosylase Mpg
VLVGPRVGVDYAGEAAAWPLRFAVAGCPAVTRRSLFVT